MMKNKLFIILNIFGMGTSIAICLVAYFAYQYDSTFDKVHQNGSTIYRISSVREFENALTLYGYAPFPLGEIVDKTIQDVDRSSYYHTSGSNFKIDDELFAANLNYVDPEFFQMFSYEFINGNPFSSVDKTSVVISEKMAIRMFRSPENAFGKTMVQVIGNQLKDVRIVGIFKEQPTNSSFYKENGSAFIAFDNYKDEYSNIDMDAWKHESTIFVQIIDAQRVKSVHQQLQSYIENNNSVRHDFQVKEFTLDPFITMAHHDRANSVQAFTWGAPPSSAIIGSVIMSLLILLIACFNLTNTTIAISARRLKEIGLRKVMGSVRAQLITQFIGETTFICFLALLIGLVMTDFLIPGWNLMTGNNIYLEARYLDNPSIIIFLIGVVLFSGLLAGSYPAFYISKFKPISILKGTVKFGGTNYFTRTLLVLQFSISLITIVSAIGFLQNARFQQQYDLGFDAKGSVIAWINNKSEYDTYKNALLENPDISSVAGAKTGIFSNRMHEPVKHQSSQVEVDVIEVGDNYIHTLDLKLIDGRDFIADSEIDRKESIIITQKMANLFQWDSPIGKEIIWKDSVKLFVIGVVKDVYTQGLWQELEPMMIRYVNPEQYTQIIASTNAGKVVTVNAFMQERWKEVFPNRLYNGYMLDGVLRQANTLNMSIVSGYSFLGFIAMLLSATGLYTLASLNIIKRMKEIGIRKIVGASVTNIIRIVNTEFIIILSIAAILGSWAGYTWCNTIMATIWKYHQSVGPSTFMAAVGLLFLISAVTIGYKVFTVATMNPVKTLRDE